MARPTIKIFALIAEVIVLLLRDSVFFQPAHKERWHERMVEYRAVAELLRQQRFIYTLGAADRPGRPADRTCASWTRGSAGMCAPRCASSAFPATRYRATCRRAVLQAFRRRRAQGETVRSHTTSCWRDDFQIADRRLEEVVRIAYWVTVIVAIVGILALGALGYVHLVANTHGQSSADT